MDIEGLRHRVDEIDAQLVRLLAEREQITTSIGTYKREHGLALYAPQRESALLERRRSEARVAGVDPDLIEDVLRRVMRGSYRSQEASLPANGDVSRPVVVVGGRGAMGRLMAGLFERSGYPVHIVDVDNAGTLPTRVVDAALVLISVPIDHTEAVIAALPALPADCVLCDITSIKQKPLKAMLAVHPGAVVGLHPMFGPDVTNLVKQVVVVCSGRDASRCEWVLRQFEAWGALLRHESPEAHDQAMQMIQAMRHFTTFAYGVFLDQQRADLERLLRLSSPIYRLELAMVGRLFAQSPTLYADIMLQADHLPALIAGYQKVLAELLELVQIRDREQLIARFAAVRSFFGDLAPRLLRESGDLLRKMHDARDGES